MISSYKILKPLYLLRISSCDEDVLQYTYLVIENRYFTLKTHHMFHCAWDIFREIAKYHRSFWSCVWEKLEQRNQITIVTQPFSKSSDFKMFFVLAKKTSWRFQIPLVCGAWRIISANCRPIRRTCVFKFLSPWTGPDRRLHLTVACHYMCHPFSKYTRWQT